MGGAKRMMEEQLHRESIALGIAVEAGALEECEFHEGTYYSGSDDIDDAIELGKEKFARGELSENFSSPQEVEEAIHAAYQENCADECHSCGRWRDDD